MVCQVGGLPYMAIIILSRLASWLLLHSSMHPSRTNVDWCLLLIVFSSPPTISVNGHDPYPSCPTGQRLMTTIYNMTKTTTTTTTTTKKKKMSDVDCFASLRLLWMARPSIVEWGVGSTYDIRYPLIFAVGGEWRSSAKGWRVSTPLWYVGTLLYCERWFVPLFSRNNTYSLSRSLCTINQTKRKKIENLAESRKWLDLGNIDPTTNQTKPKILKKYKCGKEFYYKYVVLSYGFHY